VSRAISSHATAAIAIAILLSAATLAACSGTSDTGSVPDGPAARADGGASNTPSSSGGADANSPTTPSNTGDSGTTPVSTTDASTDAPGGNCVAPGYAGNDKKVGAYCDEHTSCPFQVDPFLICTFGHDPTNTHLFCTAPCSQDSECGTGAYCVHDTLGAGCVPTQCGGAPGN
jgi:hypothetical protein